MTAERTPQTVYDATVVVDWHCVLSLCVCVVGSCGVVMHINMASFARRAVLALCVAVMNRYRQRTRIVIVTMLSLVLSLSFSFFVVSSLSLSRLPAED